MSKSKKKGDRGSSFLDDLRKEAEEQWQKRLEQHAKALREAVEEKPGQEDEFKEDYVESTPVNPKIRVGSKARSPEERKQHTWGKRLTGQWRHTDQTYHVFINHAGDHIELLFASLVVTATQNPDEDTKRSMSQLLRMGGDRMAKRSRTYLLYAHASDRPIDDKELILGTLQHDPAVEKIRFDLDTSLLQGTHWYVEALLEKINKIATSGARRIGSHPNYFEQHLGHNRVSATIRTIFWFPLTPKQFNQLRMHIFNARVQVDPDNYLVLEKGGKTVGYTDLLDAFYEVRNAAYLGSAQRKQRTENVAAALDELVEVAWFDACKLGPENGGLSPYDAGCFRLGTLQALEDNLHSIEGDQARSLLTHTAAILDVSTRQPNFDERLGLRRHAGGHNYVASLHLVEAEGLLQDAKKMHKLFKWSSKQIKRAIRKLNKLRGTVLFGSLIVENVDKHPFRGEYLLWQLGYKESKSKGDSAAFIASSGKAEHVYGQAWRPEHIPGSADLTELGASYVGGSAGKGIAGTVLRCEGSGATKPRTPLNLNFSGKSDLASLSGFGAGVTFLRTGGEIFTLIDQEGGEVLPELPDPPDEKVYGYEASGTLHFPINGARLELQAKVLLEIFAACELALLSQKGLKLEVHGYADQPDNPIKNKILSRNRAISVFNYLKNLLEGDLAVGNLPLDDLPPEKKELQKAKDAAKDGKKADIANPSTDNVKIVAHGEPNEGKKGDKSKKKPKYNPKLRRANIVINNEMRLVLSRNKDS